MQCGSVARAQGVRMSSSLVNSSSCLTSSAGIARCAPIQMCWIRPYCSRPMRRHFAVRCRAPASLAPNETLSAYCWAAIGVSAREEYSHQASFPVHPGAALPSRQFVESQLRKFEARQSSERTAGRNDNLGGPDPRHILRYLLSLKAIGIRRQGATYPCHSSCGWLFDSPSQ